MWGVEREQVGVGGTTKTEGVTPVSLLRSVLFTISPTAYIGLLCKIVVLDTLALEENGLKHL